MSIGGNLATVQRTVMAELFEKELDVRSREAVHRLEAECSVLGDTGAVQ